MAHKLVTITAAVALAWASGAAGATEALAGQYSLSATVTHVSGNTYTFDYDIGNVNQYAGGMTGLDGFTIYVPDSALFISATAPASYNGAPGYWAGNPGTMLDLMGNGSQNLAPPAGYHTYTWWGMDPSSVYPAGQTAHFSITLDNVAAGANTMGMTSYFGWATPAGQSYVTNAYGNYTTFVTEAASPMAAVPEPETYAMLLAGLGLLGWMARRRA